MNKTWKERYKDIKMMRESGMTYKEIGLKFRLSIQRVRQIYLRGERERISGEPPCDRRIYRALYRWSGERPPKDQGAFRVWLTDRLNEGLPKIRNMGVKSYLEIQDIVGEPIDYIDGAYRFVK